MKNKKDKSTYRKETFHEEHPEENRANPQTEDRDEMRDDVRKRSPEKPAYMLDEGQASGHVENMHGEDRSDTFSEPAKAKQNGSEAGMYRAGAEDGTAPESRSRKLEEERVRLQQTKKGRKQLQKEEKKEKKRQKKAMKKAIKKQRLSVAPVIPMAILICLLIVLFALRNMLFNVPDPSLIDLLEGSYTAPEVTVDDSAATQEPAQETTPVTQTQNEEAGTGASSATDAEEP